MGRILGLMNGIYLLLGTNLGDRSSNLQMALDLLKRNGCRIVQASMVYGSEPWGISDQPAFLNQVVQTETEHSPEELLALLLKTEKEMGRIRRVKWGERLIDLDILYYNDLICQSKTLEVPHPEIGNRRFTLVPLVELAPDEKHPVSGLSQSQLLSDCPDPLKVWPVPTEDKK